MTSNEKRAEARYQRRKAARELKKKNSQPTYDEITTFQNLYKANNKSRKGVTWKASVQTYQNHLLENLVKLSWKLQAEKPVSTGFVEFDLIERGKLRHIKSVHYQERIVQRCICDNALVPIGIKSQIPDSYACLPGRGVSQALKRFNTNFRHFINKHNGEGYVVLSDFRSYFDNISHEKCYEIYDKLIYDPQIRSYLKQTIKPFGTASKTIMSFDHCGRHCKRTIPSSDPKDYTGIGLGLGSQVSQITAVFYGNDFDHFMKQELKVKEYGRYMDDTYAFFETLEQAREAIAKMRRFCGSHGLTMHPSKTSIVKLSRAIPFLKVRHFMTESKGIRKSLIKKNLRKTRSKLKKLLALNPQEAEISLRSWTGNARKKGSPKAIYHIERDFEKWKKECPATK